MAVLPTMLLMIAGAGQAPQATLVERAHFHCLVRNVDSLIGRGRKVNVDISRCPPALRRDYTSWPTERVKTVIPLTDRELRCIRSNREHLSRIVRDHGNGLYELRLRRCP